MWSLGFDRQAGPGHAAVDQVGPVLVLNLLQLAFDEADQALDFRGLGGEVFGVFPGQANGMDFCGFWLIEAVA